MLNLDTIVGAGDTLLPSEGFWGFLLDHWIAIAIAVMIVGFVIDQVLYVVRYRPQDSWRAAYYRFRRFLTERFGAKPAEEPPVPEEYNPLEHSGLTERREEPKPVIRRAQPAPAPLREEPVVRAPIQRQTPHDPPTIRRGGAQYSPHRAEPEAVDDDAPLVVRAAHTPPPVSAEPTTQNGNNRTE
ncbi:MAG: hypothetical protein ACI4XW_08715 [Candidatus Spyradocola sp.]